MPPWIPKSQTDLTVELSLCCWAQCRRMDAGVTFMIRNSRTVLKNNYFITNENLIIFLKKPTTWNSHVFSWQAFPPEIHADWYLLAEEARWTSLMPCVNRCITVTSALELIGVVDQNFKKGTCSVVLNRFIKSNQWYHLFILLFDLWAWLVNINHFFIKHVLWRFWRELWRSYRCVDKKTARSDQFKSSVFYLIFNPPCS